jgi:hypothetical protein
MIHIQVNQNYEVEDLCRITCRGPKCVTDYLNRQGILPIPNSRPKVYTGASLVGAVFYPVKSPEQAAREKEQARQRALHASRIAAAKRRAQWVENREPAETTAR